MSGVLCVGHDTLSITLHLEHTLAADNAFLCDPKGSSGVGQGTDELLVHHIIRCGLHIVIVHLLICESTMCQHTERGWQRV